MINYSHHILQFGARVNRFHVFFDCKSISTSFWDLLAATFISSLRND